MLSKTILKLATPFLLLAIFFAPLQGFAPVARAQEPAPGSPVFNAAQSQVPQALVNANAALPAAQQQTPAQLSADQQAANAQLPTSQQLTPAQLAAQTPGSTPQQTPAAASCAWLTGTWSVCLSNIVYVFTVGLMSIFAYIGGYVFDYALQITLNSATYAQSFLTQGWAAVRDIANMAFIFILVYIAITIILKVETAGTLKALASVIVMALLINFSFFFTRVVIDAGNILAVQVYNAIPANALANAGQQGAIAGAVGASANALSPSGGATKDLTANIMNATGVTSLLGTGSFSAAVVNKGDFMTNLIVLSFVYIAMGAMLAILATVFVGAGVKFIIRSVILWFLIVAAPLAFIAKAFDGVGKAKSVSKYFDQWLKMLVEFSFFPAFFLFMFWIINLFATQMGGQCGTGASAGQNCGLLGAAFANAANTASASTWTDSFINLGSIVASIGIRLGILIAMLYFSLKISDMFAKQGSSIVHNATGRVGGMAKGYGNWWAGKAQGAAMLPVRGAQFGAGVLYRKGVGGGANYLKNKATGSRFWNSESNLNWRNASRYWAGKKVLEPLADSSLGGALSFKKRDEYIKARTKDTTNNNRAIQNKEDKKALEETLKTIVADPNFRRDVEGDRAAFAAGLYVTPEGQAKITMADKEARLSARINGFSTGEIEAAMPKASDVMSIMKSIKESTMKKIQASDRYSDQNKEEMQARWHEESFDAPLQKATALLQKIEKDLQRNGIVMQKMFQPGSVVNSGTIDGILKNLRDGIATETVNRQNAKDPGDKYIAAKKVEDFRKLMVDTSKAAEHLANTPQREIKT